jgi:hypothetical protein
MRTPLSTILLLITLFGCAQGDTATLDFLNHVITRKHDTSAIFYTDKVDAGMYDNMMKMSLSKRTIKDIGNATNDKLTLTSEEIAYIKEHLTTAKNKTWNDDLFTNSTRIPTDSSHSFLSQNRSRDLYLFSQPVFIRKNTIALFYVVHLCCGGIYGPVDLSFYRRNGKTWQRWIRIDGGSF